jgi:hypothetical protein
MRTDTMSKLLVIVSLVFALAVLINLLISEETLAAGPAGCNAVCTNGGGCIAKDRLALVKVQTVVAQQRVVVVIPDVVTQAAVRHA